MADETTAALQALIAQVTALTEKVEAQDKKYDDVYKMNGELLTKLKGPKSDAPPSTQKTDDLLASLASMTALAEKQLAGNSDDVDGYRKGDAIRLSRTDALDPRKYAAAQAKATELNVSLELIDDRPSAQQERPASYQSREVDTSIVDHIDDTAQKLRYVRADVANGGAGIIQNGLAAERDGYRMVTFKDESDLPDHMQTKLSLMASAAQAGSNDGE
jgi:hypothetical protein